MEGRWKKVRSESGAKWRRTKVRKRRKNAEGEAGVEARGEKGWRGGGEAHTKSGDKQPSLRILDEVRTG